MNCVFDAISKQNQLALQQSSDLGRVNTLGSLGLERATRVQNCSCYMQVTEDANYLSQCKKINGLAISQQQNEEVVFNHFVNLLSQTQVRTAWDMFEKILVSSKTRLSRRKSSKRL
jgi:hypothetical protein